MKKRKTLLLTSASLVLPAALSAATLVVNSEIDTSKVDAEQVELIYLGKKTLWESGQRIVPVLVNEESDESKQFLENVLKKSVSQYRAYWKRRLFSGGGTVPKTFRTSGEVVEFVARTPGAIGVVQAGAKDTRVKVVDIRE
jgi:ABC-type phosphate transport system substrate-binding protein